MNVERLKLAVDALKRLSPHKGRYAYYKPSIGKYAITRTPPTDAVFARHVIGQALIGAVSGDDDGKTTSVGIDVDRHSSEQRPAAATRRFIATANAWNVPVLVHSSKSGQGIHVRTLFSERVPQLLARALYLYLAEVAGIDQFKALDKVWPPSVGQGVLAMPLQIKYMKENCGSMAIDPNTFEAYDMSDQIDVILEADALTYKDLLEILRAMGFKNGDQARAYAGAGARQGPIKEGVDGGLSYMVKHCLAVDRLSTEACSIGYEFWFAMMTNFRPFNGGREVFEAYCQLDAKRYKPRELDQSWRAIAGGPRMCSNLDPGWICPNFGTCACKSPAGLPFWLAREGKLG